MLTRYRYESCAFALEFVLEHLDPLHRLGEQVPFDAGGGTSGRRPNALASIAIAQVDDHRPLSDSRERRLDFVGGLLTSQALEGFRKAYVPSERVMVADPDAFWPVTGAQVRPDALYVPRQGRGRRS